MSYKTPDIFFKGLNLLHKTVLTLSGGRLATNLLGMQVVELTTTGRKSGEPRKVMLTAPIDEGSRVVLVASKNGNPGHPAWYLNLSDNPEVEIDRRDGKGQVPMRARVLSSAERAELWDGITETYKGYAGYQKKTDREIPVIELTPR